MKTIATHNGETVGSVVHCFERAGLGKAPFHYTGMTENVFRAHPNAPAKPGGSCDYCGASITYEFHIRSADGKSFKVGSDCVHKTDDAGLRRVVDAKVREIKRLANIARQDALIGRGKAALEIDSVREKLSATPHPNADRAARGESKLSMILWYFDNAGRAGKTWAARECLKALGFNAAEIANADAVAL